MATNTRLAFIGLGVPTTAASTVTIFESGQSGTLGAKRVLTHPDGVNFAPITYTRNPTRTFNLDNVVLPSPDAQAILTLSSTQVVRFDRKLEDTIITERWEGADGRLVSVPTFFIRQLYEYLINPPAFAPLAQTFVTWQPRDRSTLTYNIQFFRMVVGGGGARADQVFDIDDFRLPPGPEIINPLESLDVNPTGVTTRSVEIKLRVVSVLP